MRHSTPEEVLPHIQQYGGHVLHTSLDEAAELPLRAAPGEPASGG